MPRQVTSHSSQPLLLMLLLLVLLVLGLPL